ncbi:cytochrome d ubiquinol oxidase subunit II [Spirosoma luteolum]
MLYVVIAYLWAAILLYLLMGGADFGAGIVELVTSAANKRSTRKRMYQTIGPIWEANHMWLIIAIVILFVGFPAIYTTVSIHLHIPLTIMLLGIIARGTAFTFRNYDAVVDGMAVVYDRIFMYSSVITPLFLGIIAASAVAGTIDPQAGDFLSAYVFSWLSFFSVSVGLFTVAICGYLAAIYIIGDTESPAERQRYIRKAQYLNGAAVACGGLVFVAAWHDHVPLIDWVFGHWAGRLAILAATLSLVVMWYGLAHGDRYRARLLAGFQITMILLTTTYRHFPNIVLLKHQGSLSLLQHQGQAKTIDALGVALLAGSVLILPALGYLLYSFQKTAAAHPASEQV